MSEQTVETAIETEFKPNADGNLEPQSMEDKFFGVKTEIPTNKDSEELKVEVVDDIPEEDREKYDGHERRLDVENAEKFGQFEFIEACQSMGIIKEEEFSNG